MTGRIVDLAAVRELRRLVALIDPDFPDVELVRAIHAAAFRAGDHERMRWASDAFDAAHDACYACRKAAG